MWVWTIIVGFVLGVIAKLILPGKQPIPWWLTIICGVLGSFLGNAVAGWIGVRHTNGVDWIRHILQLAGAVLLVALGTRFWLSVRGPRETTR
jgi:uncharacterized membrane protein YeaQ/YmgE (transglycosylase-associated protein family)